MSTKAENNENHCEFCDRTFARASTALKHICERKHRWLERDRPSNRLAFQGWLQFYSHTTATKKPRDANEFIRSSYYTAFVKWGNYCIGVGALNPSRYLDWLLKNNRRIDIWATDTVYDEYLKHYLRAEDPLDAVYRAVEWSIDYAEELGIRPQDVLRFGNTNRLIQAVTSGRISAWVLFHSASGHEFVNRLQPEQQNFINDYVDPVQFQILFKRFPDKVDSVTAILREAGW